MYISGKNLCIGCMRPLDSERACSFCGLIQEDYSPIPRCLAPGTELAGRYITGKVLGEGSFGITYMGWDKRMGMAVAIKEYFPSDMVSRDVICGSDNSVYLYESQKKCDYDTYLKKFFDEAKCLSRFNQIKGIVSVLDFFYENNTAYIVMQYIDGISVKEYVAKNGKINAKQVLEMIRPVLTALEQVHATGIVHRDISPDNMIIRRDGSLVLIDFGAARMHNIDYTKTMTVMFKRGFSPEEQYRTKGRWGAYTDVYSVCAVVYFMMTGKAPVDSVIRALGDDMPSLATMKEIGIPLRQRKAVMKGMAVSAKNRWQSIRELYEALYDEDFARERLGGKNIIFRRLAAGAGLFLMLFGTYGFFGAGDEKQNAQISSGNALADSGGKADATPEAEALLMENFLSMPKEKAEKRLESYQDRLIVNWEQNYSDDVKKDCIISQSVSEGTKLVEGEKHPVTFVVSRGKKKVKVPALAGLRVEAAREKLEKKKLKCKINRVESAKEKGTVIRQSIKDGKKVANGTCVTLTVSKGKVTVPSVPAAAPTARPSDPGQGSKGGKTGQREKFVGVIQ